jgi:hypothetical protein
MAGLLPFAPRKQRECLATFAGAKGDVSGKTARRDRRFCTTGPKISSSDETMTVVVTKDRSATCSPTHSFDPPRKVKDALQNPPVARTLRVRNPDTPTMHTPRVRKKNASYRSESANLTRMSAGPSSPRRVIVSPENS